MISDFWIQNRSFLKIKNIQLGYSFSKSAFPSLPVERIRIYGSLENFFTFTKYDGLDPEVDGVDYPAMKQAVIHPAPEAANLPTECRVRAFWKKGIPVGENG